MYRLYWIKYPEHIDPFSEGYIGITSQTIEKRFSNHKCNNKNKHLKNRCRQEVVEIVCLEDNLSKEEARLLEEKYRPEINIGWNINKGGDLPPSQKGKSHSSWSAKGDDRTEKQKMAAKKHSERMKGTNYSGMRKNRVNYSKPCENCGKIFDPKYEKTKKYCCIKCAVEKRNNNTEYKNRLSQIQKEKWQDTEYRTKQTELIKKGVNVGQ